MLESSSTWTRTEVSAVCFSLNLARAPRVADGASTLVGMILDREEQERVKKHEEAKVASENARKASETRTLPPRFAEVWNKCSPAAFVEPANGPSVLPILSY